jgi:hypothetical protein
MCQSRSTIFPGILIFVQQQIPTLGVNNVKKKCEIILLI